MATTPTDAESAVAAAAVATTSSTSNISAVPPAPVDKPPAKKRKAGSNQHTAARDAREREAAALLLQQQQQANGSTPDAGSSAPAVAGSLALPVAAPPTGPVSHKRKSNALLRDILSSSTPSASSGGPAQHPSTPRPHPTSIDISSRPSTSHSAVGGGAGSFSQAGSPAPSRSGTDDGLDDEGRLEAWMLEFVDVRECLVRDARVKRALERVRKRWAAEIPVPVVRVLSPPSLPLVPVVAEAPELETVAEEVKPPAIGEEVKFTAEPSVIASDTVC